MGIGKFDKNRLLIWKDRKRNFGLPLSFTRYYLVENVGRWTKLHSSIGFLSTIDEELYLYRVDDLTVIQTLADKAFGVGTIKVWCKDASSEYVLLKRIKNPFKVRELLASLIEKERERKGVKYSELQI